MDNTFKRHNLFALLRDLFVAALVGEAAGGGLWCLSLIGGTRLITFYRASLWPSPSASSSLFRQATEQIHIHHGLIAWGSCHWSEWVVCFCTWQDTPAFFFNYEKIGVRLWYILMLRRRHRDNVAKDNERAKNDNSKNHWWFCFTITVESITHSSVSESQNHPPDHQGAVMYL